MNKITKRKKHKAGYFIKPKTDEERFGTNKLKAIIYVRVSSDGQVNQGHGLESQEYACREWCKKQAGLEIEIVKVFREEGVSGKFMDRKAINDAIRFLEKENKKYTKIHYFVVTDADRIARPDDIAEAFMLEQSIESHGVKIITANNKRDMETDEGKFLHTIQYAIAGLERRKILRRTMNGRLSSLKNGGRPFPNPPAGYQREKLPNSGYIDTIDRLKGPIIKEGLELYAYNPLFTKSQLHKFWIDKGLKTNQSTGKLYISFIEKMFKDYRLYFYAGFIYYPEREIFTPIKGKQESLISLEVVEKIMEKEKNKTVRSTSPNFDEKLKEHPLKGLITCTDCKRKLGCYASRGKKGGLYYYYNCGNKYCKRTSIRKEYLESEFKELISKMKLSKPVFDLYKTHIVKERKLKGTPNSLNLPQLQGQILSIQAKMKKIEDKILSISNEKLIQQLENDWSTLETMKEDIEMKISNQNKESIDIEKMISEAEFLFTNPVQKREKSNYELRQLLFRVWFGGILFYEKNQGFQTPETTGLNYLFSSKGDAKNRVMTQGGTHTRSKLFSNSELENIFLILMAQRKYIEAIHKVNEIHGLNLMDD